MSRSWSGSRTASGGWTGSSGSRTRPGGAGGESLMPVWRRKIEAIEIYRRRVLMTVSSLRIPFVGSFLAVLVSSALVGQTPVDTAATVAAAERAAQVWLAIVDKGDIAKSWDEAALAFQLAVTQTKWEQAVKGARGPFEPFGTRRRIMARYTTEPPN